MNTKHWGKHPDCVYSHSSCFLSSVPQTMSAALLEAWGRGMCNWGACVQCRKTRRVCRDVNVKEKTIASSWRVMIKDRLRRSQKQPPAFPLKLKLSFLFCVKSREQCWDWKKSSAPFTTTKQRAQRQKTQCPPWGSFLEIHTVTQ